jgi:hypothetical protein
VGCDRILDAFAKIGETVISLNYKTICGRINGRRGKK